MANVFSAAVTSSASYLSSSEVKGWKVRSVEVSWNWLQLMHYTYLQSHPGYFEWRLRIAFLECSRMEEVYQNNSKYECEGKGDGGLE